MSARSAREEAQRFLDQLRAAQFAEFGTFPRRLDPAVVKDVVNRYLRDSLIPEEGQDPQQRAVAERAAALGLQSVDDMFSEMLAKMQDNIEKTAAARIKGLELGRRPLVGHLQTGQLNAVSMLVPGRAGAHLVLFHDQMPLFASKISKAVAWAIPHGPTDANGMMTFKLSMDDVTERIEADPEIAARFADIIVKYAEGNLDQAGHHLMPPGYHNFARQLCDSLEYFVLGHEYAHILLDHLDTTAARKGVVPATEAEVLAYSWQQEHAADWMGMILSVNTCIEHHSMDIYNGFSGIGLFFDALDVMDRAVALLETGDETARQLGSHPPSGRRKQLLCDFLPALGGGESADAERVTTALLVAEIQGEIIRLLWERTRPILLDQHRRGVRPDPRWRPIPKETGDEPAPAPPSALVPKQVRRPGWRWGRSG